MAGGAILGDGVGEPADVHAELVVGGDLSHTLFAQAEDQPRLFHRGVRLLRGIEAKSRKLGAARHA